ncbi:MAG TPA: hypothetical protein EYP14_20740 [Planctomycetaceae bacterium]|nr:hypothetical protein [Planctomycetaceae bacterium]
MVCIHLRQLYQLCLEQQIRLSSSDLVRIVCQQCGEQEICPSNLMELESDTPTQEDADAPAPPTDSKPPS